jgi:hypothetical protein
VITELTIAILFALGLGIRHHAVSFFTFLAPSLTELGQNAAPPEKTLQFKKELITLSPSDVAEGSC